MSDQENVFELFDSQSILKKKHVLTLESVYVHWWLSNLAEQLYQHLPNMKYISDLCADIYSIIDDYLIQRDLGLLTTYRVVVGMVRNGRLNVGVEWRIQHISGKIIEMPVFSQVRSGSHNSLAHVKFGCVWISIISHWRIYRAFILKFPLDEHNRIHQHLFLLFRLLQWVFLLTSMTSS